MKRSLFFRIRSTLLALLLLLAAVFVLFAGSKQMSDSAVQESKRIADEAIARALVTCYALEGSYPPSFSHLEEHYGIQIDHDRYIVDYRIFASNVKPSVTLVNRK
jgi:hypothetical protein